MRSASTCPERRRALAGAALVTLGLFTVPHASAQTGGEPRTPAAVFRGQSELVVLQVAVVDQHHRFVPDLQVTDFAVFEEGTQQPVTLFASTAAPLDLMLVLDTSASMRGRMEVARDAALKFIRTLKPGDRASVVLFNNTVHLSHVLTGDIAPLEAAIRDAAPTGATAVHDAVYIALRELARARRTSGQLRRQALVVVSDGDDNMSRMGFRDVLEQAMESAVTIFTIVPSSPSDTFHIPGRPPAEGRFDMRKIAQETGGRSFATARIEDLAAVYQEIASELAQQYWLAYAPPPAAKAQFRRVSVRLEARPGLSARTRSGYYVTVPLRGPSTSSERRSLP
jgi:VWFA-related protein